MTSKVAVAVSLAIALIVSGCSNEGADKRSADPIVDSIAGGVFVSQIPRKLVESTPLSHNRCALDTINGKTRSPENAWHLRRGQEAHLSGWVLGPSSHVTGPEVYIRIDGNGKRYVGLTTSRGPREDVAKASNVALDLSIGFALRAKTDQVETGAYSVAVVQSSTVGPTECQVPGKLIIE